MSEIGDTYFNEWPENSPIGWWNEGRKKLNIIIRMANEWTLNGKPAEENIMLLRRIDMGKQTFASQDGGGGWWDELDEIEKYIRKVD